MPRDIAEQLRIAVRDSGLNLNRLAKKAGVPQPVLWRFMQGQDIHFSTARKLASFLGLQLRK